MTATARAPGRLDVMGGIADYSGSLVLQLPIAAAAVAEAQWAPPDSGLVTVHTRNASEIGGVAEVSMPLGELLDGYEVVRGRVAADPARKWFAYVAGAITVLHHERGIRFDRSVEWVLSSDVPPGKGVASSAAVEVAAMSALAGLVDPRLREDGRELALLCQKVENLVVGAPCGVMDQMTAACGEANMLLALLCQPAELQSAVPVPEELEFVGIDSGIRHEVAGADYGSVRVGAFMGSRILSSLGSRHRYLADITPGDWETRFRDAVPASLLGSRFLQTYGSHGDPVTTIDPERTYAVRQPTAHPIYEHDRVQRFGVLLTRRPLTERVLGELGELMYWSHASYGACGLGSSGTDTLVQLVRESGPAAGLFGAKITGGGSGGTVAVLARRGSRAAIDQIVASYERATGQKAAVISGSSDGAVLFVRRHKS